jgi:hypothetical protein
MRKMVLALMLCLIALPKAQAGGWEFIGYGHHFHHVVSSGGISKGGTTFAFGPEVFFSPLIIACIWHMPAWELAKANHTERAYQQQEMWPQQLFDKLPGGTPGRLNG